MALRYAALGNRMCIEVRGEDAGAFLHGQLTQTVLGLGPNDAPLAAWADPRGRVRALFRLVREPERWLLVTPRAGAETVRKKLSLFVLRSKVTLAEADDLAVAAVLGDPHAALAELELPADTAANRTVRRADLTFVRVGAECWHVLGASEALERLRARLEQTTEAAASLAEIRLGIPEIAPETSERFVAQMLNLDTLGVVSFNKGCYPGQEIIARVRNLGGVKRHARRYARSGEPPASGMAVAASGGENVGEVVRAAPTPTGAELLAVIEDAAASAALTCGGAALTELPLPFAVPRA